ncbi:condensation domain-containing protein [Lentzea sp. JNUCC 0626]|uniref:non-ribosomal peptide synthetase n=1 Tax=Lentzea sp. JNUCC 0626 TaxID=3367513 RepID=UPI003748546F
MFELSASQQIVWLHEELSPGSRAYNFTATVDLRGSLDVPVLRDALSAALERHAGLRLELVERPGQNPAQRVREQCPPRWRTADLSGETDPETAFAHMLMEEARTPLDTSEAPLLRWCVVRLSERHHRIIHVEHHLIHDGWSFAVLLRDVFGGYRSRVLGEDFSPPPAGSFEDHVRSRRAPGEQSVEFWRDELAGADFDLPMPGVSQVRAERARDGMQLRQPIEPGVATALRALCRERGHTPFTALLGLFAELLRRHSGRTDVVIGSAVGNRPEGFESTIGMFVNTIPLRLKLDPAATASEAVDNAIDTLFGCLPHQDVPVQTITRALELRTDGVNNPLFDVVFSSHDAVLPDVEVPDLDIALFEGVNTGTARFDLNVVLIPDDRRVVGAKAGQGGMVVVWEFDQSRFTRAAVLQLQQRLLGLLEAYLADPDAIVASLDAVPLIAPEDAGEAGCSVLDDWRHRPADGLAIIAGSDRITRGELDRRVADLVSELSGAGVRAGQPVAFVLPRGVSSVVALLACLRLSAVYCPLSVDDPPTRLELLTRRLNPALVVTTENHASALGDQPPPVALLDRGSFPAAAPVPVIEGDAAYVLHTSGSTGVPKPVVVGRAALAGYVERIADRFELTADDRVLHFAQPVFDVALGDILPTLHKGATIVVPDVDFPAPAELVGLMADQGVTAVTLTTSHVLAAQDEMCAALADGRWSPRLLVMFGERLLGGVIRSLRDAFDGVLLNAYGITEAAVTTTTHEITEADPDTDDVPLGVELPGTRMYVLDNGHRPLPDGAVGELAIAGWGLADGYRGDDATTAARFPVVEGERVYLSGDLGYRDAAGRLNFLGRADNQVKVRGYRIELEEVEAVAAEALDLPGCVVVVDRSGAEPRLVGFYVGEQDVDGDLMREALARRLPAPLVPADWARLEALPTMPGGKTDRGKLKKMAADVRPAEELPFAESGDEVRSLVARGWQEVLGHDRFTGSSDFFRVGGHSMLLARLAAWLELELGGRPPLHLLFQHTVLAKQADAVRELVL